MRSSSATINNNINNVVQLSYLENTVNNKSGGAPPALLIHGLDSSSHTWRDVLDDLGKTNINAVALDLRGSGKSPLGDPDQFTSDAIVNDIHAFLCSHPYFCAADSDTDNKAGSTSSIKPFVIVGHSMGGRVAMSFAARYPELLKALVIEDMDVCMRPIELSRIRSQDRQKTLRFDRSMDIKDEKEVLERFQQEGYPKSQIQKWFQEGRVEKQQSNDGDSYYYSHVNPAFRLLCYEQFFVTNHGEETWMELVRQSSGFPVHVMIADTEMTICDEQSISFMENAMNEKNEIGKLSPSTTPTMMMTHRYKGATHSIHNSVSDKFLSDLKTIILEGTKM